MARSGKLGHTIFNMYSYEKHQPLRRAMTSCVSRYYNGLGIGSDKSSHRIEYFLTPQKYLLHGRSTKYSQLGDEGTIRDRNELVKEHSLKVPSFGGCIVTNTNIDVGIKSADTAEFQNLDQAFVRLFSSPDLENNAPSLSIKQEDLTLSVSCHSQNSAKESHDKLDAEVPIVYSVKVCAESYANVEVFDFIESNYVDIKAEHGAVKTHKIKTEKVIINSTSGDIVCQGALQGDVTIKSKSGNITSKKRFVGPNADLETDTGDITIASSYSDRNKFCTNRGFLNLKNVHNESQVIVNQEGNVNMQGVDGSSNIFIEKGDLNIQISRITDTSSIRVNDGNINLKMSDSCHINLSIESKNITLDSKSSKLGEIKQDGATNISKFTTSAEPNLSSPELHVVAENGTVSVEMQSWAASLGFNLPNS